MNTPEHTAITAVVLTYNSERVLLPCLQSLQFCSSLLLIDSGSTDATLEIAQQCGAHIIHRKWDTYQGQYSFALEQVRTPWTLVIDSDEICSPQLQKSIQYAMTSSKSEVFLLARRTWYLDRFLSHGSWYPEYIARFFRTGRVHINVNTGGHIEFCSSHQAEKLSGDILHYTYASYYEQLHKLNTYAENGAIALRNKGKKGGVFYAIVHACGRFIVQYIFRRGFLDGRAGFILAVHESFYVFCKYIRVIEDSWGKPYIYTQDIVTAGNEKE